MTAGMTAGRFPVWEGVVMVFAILSGIRGLAAPPPASNVLALLGGYGFLFYLALVLAGIGTLVGLGLRGTDSVVVLLTSSVALAVACATVYGGVVVITRDLLYTGAVSILIFAFGATFRAIQLSRQLRQLRRVLESGPPP